MPDRRAACLILATVACSRRPETPGITVGAATSTEQTILAEIAAQQIARRASVEPKRVFSFLSVEHCHQAQLAGQVDVHPAYAGTALTQILRAPAEPNPEFALNRLRQHYAAQFAMEWLDPLGFDARFAVFARANAGVKALSEIAGGRRRWRIAVTSEFLRHGYAALMKNYRPALEPARSLEPRELAEALAEGKVDLAAARASDGWLADPAFHALEDDRSAFLSNEAAYVVRRDAIERIPGARKALQELAGRVSLAEMRRMSRQVDREKRLAAQVAAEFLQGLP
jgi:osmoprotectant transport system permease protein